MEQDDLQLQCEHDRTLVAHLIFHLAPHFRKNKAGCIKAWEQMGTAVRALYGHEPEGVHGNWQEVMLVTRLVRDIQAQCSDLAHAEEILRLLRYTINWQYQPGVQNKAPYEDYLSLKVVGGWGAAVLFAPCLQVLDFLPQSW